MEIIIAFKGEIASIDLGPSNATTIIMLYIALPPTMYLYESYSSGIRSLEAGQSSQLLDGEEE